MYELGGAKQAGSTYAHAGPAGKRGRSLREGRKNTPAPLLAAGRPPGPLPGPLVPPAASPSEAARLTPRQIPPAVRFILL